MTPDSGRIISITAWLGNRALLYTVRLPMLSRPADSPGVASIDSASLVGLAWTDRSSVFSACRATASVDKQCDVNVASEPMAVSTLLGAANSTSSVGAEKGNDIGGLVDDRLVYLVCSSSDWPSGRSIAGAFGDFPPKFSALSSFKRELSLLTDFVMNSLHDFSSGK